MKAPTKCVLYARVSPSPSARAIAKRGEVGLSIEAQLAECRAHAARKGYEVIGEHTDQAISGKDELERRPGLKAVVSAAAKRNIVVIVYNLSRLARRQALVWQLLDDRGEYRLLLECTSQSFDTSTPMGRALLGMLATFAQLQADMTGEATSSALQQRKREGVRLGAKPLEVTSPLTAEHVRGLVRVGMSYAAIAESLNTTPEYGTQHGKRWHKTTVARLIQRMGLDQSKGSNAGSRG